MRNYGTADELDISCKEGPLSAYVAIADRHTTTSIHPLIGIQLFGVKYGLGGVAGFAHPFKFGNNLPW